MATLDKDLLNEWLSTMVRVFVGAGMTPADFAAAVVADVGDTTTPTVKVTVANQTARYALTTAEVQAGDYVYQTDTATLYEVIDATALSSSAGYAEQPALATSGTPAMDGTAARGTSVVAARADHVHPTDTSRAASTHTHADNEYNVHVLSTGAVGTGGRINTNIPATYGAYQVNFQYVVGQGSRPATGRFYFRVFDNSGSPGLTDVYGSTSGSDIQTMRVEISGGLLVFHIYGSYYDIFFNIKSSVAISSAALEGWTVAAYADNGSVVERTNYSRDTQYFSSVGADNYVTSPLIGKSIYGPFCPLHKVDASAPTTGSDTSANFKVGDLWTDTATSRLYVCLDATNGAAVWKYTALT